MSDTISLCPECLRRLPGKVIQRGDEVWLERTCPQHGEARALVWRGPPDYDEWRRATTGSACWAPPENPACPTSCGLCPGHARQTCCILLEVTARCDLECPVCFASAQQAAKEDPPSEVVEGWLRRLLEVAPGCNVQLSGGEPTLRDDLAELIAFGRSIGLPFFQLNTNGLRLAGEEGYAEELAAAGLDTVFLQFDGVDDAPYEALRGRPLAAQKMRAIARCEAAGLGVVLVPTVVRDVNLDCLGDILDFALERLPAVRGVHLQPLALLGRYPHSQEDEAARVTLPDAMRALADQSGGRVRLADLLPGDCEHPLCSFSREYLRQADTLVPLARAETDGCGCGAPAGPRSLAPADKAAHVARRWAGARSEPAGDQWARLLQQIHANTFSVSGMAFQDAWTVDLQRLRHCYLHVLAADGRVVPFCAYNLTATDGRGLPGGRRPPSADAHSDDPASTSGISPARSQSRHRSGCMVCGRELVYGGPERPHSCCYCGRSVQTAASCTAGHYVCDACHSSDALDLIEAVCLQSRETDAVALMQTIRSHPRFPVHGPEHHSLVPAVILTALRNGGLDVTDQQIGAAVQRGQTIAGGACGFLGACGAALGVGIAASLLLGAHPCDGRTRQTVQQMTQATLAAIAAYDAPRCCQRDCWLALTQAAQLLHEQTGYVLRADHPLHCEQHAENRECIGDRCPLWTPFSAGAHTGR